MHGTTENCGFPWCFGKTEENEEEKCPYVRKEK
jgi:hypothetical protein